MKKLEKFLKRKIKIIDRALIVLIATILLLSIYLIGSPWINQTLATAMSVKQDTFTELYFENHTQLPKLVDANKNYTYKFTIHNKTGNDITYTYSVYYDINGVKYFLDNNTALIKNGGYKSIQEVFIPTSTLPRVKIVVELVNIHQQIAFWTQLYR